MDGLFDIENIKTFNPKDLDGKVLFMKTVEYEGMIVIAGQDIETKEIYIINIKSS